MNAKGDHVHKRVEDVKTPTGRTRVLATLDIPVMGTTVQVMKIFFSRWLLWNDFFLGIANLIHIDVFFYFSQDNIY